MKRLLSLHSHCQRSSSDQNENCKQTCLSLSSFSQFFFFFEENNLEKAVMARRAWKVKLISLFLQDLRHHHTSDVWESRPADETTDTGTNTQDLNIDGESSRETRVWFCLRGMTFVRFKEKI